METFANYILNEHNYIKKMEIVYYLQKRADIFFDNSVILKTEIARLFLEESNLSGIDSNLVITACLLCNCKKMKDPADVDRLKVYAKEGADFLRKLGFPERFCKICEQVNRYSGLMPREPEGDILELVDNLGGLLLDRPERRAFPIDEAITLLEYRNLKNVDNMYLKTFKSFVAQEEGIDI